MSAKEIRLRRFSMFFSEEESRGEWDCFKLETLKQKLIVVPGGGLEPPHLAAYAPQTYLSTNSNIRAKELKTTKREGKNKDFPV